MTTETNPKLIELGYTTRDDVLASIDHLHDELVRYEGTMDWDMITQIEDELNYIHDAINEEKNDVN